MMRRLLAPKDGSPDVVETVVIVSSDRDEMLQVIGSSLLREVVRVLFYDAPGRHPADLKIEPVGCAGGGEEYLVATSGAGWNRPKQVKRDALIEFVERYFRERPLAQNGGTDDGEDRPRWVKMAVPVRPAIPAVARPGQLDLFGSAS